MKIKIFLTDDIGQVHEGETTLRKIDRIEKVASIELERIDSDPMESLAKSCDVTKEKLKRIIDYENGEFIFIGNLDEQDSNKKRAKACHYILTAMMKGKGIEWVDNSVVIESLRKLGIDGKNMNRSIDSKGGIFRTKGQKAGLKYSLTIPGWKTGLSMLKAEAEKM